ncbi:hypothetical protein EDD27_0794 [Nonomuraea polychroma]|uniref:Excreted virulence factor EspC (Type VII ESX diderm) n=1 Tax=Nonomuraea polychroma TaxID=46176 RepID=A0A438LYB9_9ACTN|nr:hypothetical protein [Nonomuraea polychroma]RVX38482.1 hypothetical protein EDD27_0794 [Nonomuraea polychroma]
MTTRQQLLREAAAKEALASTFTRYAKGLADAFDGIPSQQGEFDPFWKGPAMERYRAHAIRLRRDMDELEDSCLATAENLRRRAKRLREDAANLTSQ